MRMARRLSELWITRQKIQNLKYNNNVFEVDAEYNDGTSNHSIYIKNTRTSEGVVQISIELDGVSYYFENSMGPDGYPSN